MSKNAAAALLRRLLAVRITQSLIQMVAVRDMSRATPALPQRERRADSARYEHHIEPRINQFKWTNNEWLAYLHGYR